MSAPSFWENQEKAKVVAELVTQHKQCISPVIDLKKEVEDLQVMCELIADAPEEEASAYLQEIAESTSSLLEKVDTIEIRSFLQGPHDQSNAIMSLHAGAGGTESCDWAEMLLRMYSRWAERAGFKIEIQDIQAGEEAGINSATFIINGTNAYGYAKAERGIHRLVRISPFDSNSRRHTSFCGVDVIAEVKDDIEIEIKDEDLRIDTFRSSGKGGQHVNKTDSAVRITHLPTNIAVACQNERSQHKNKATALKVLKSRLFQKMEDEKRTEMEKFYGEKNEIGWGNQIRSYVFHPYQLATV